MYQIIISNLNTTSQLYDLDFRSYDPILGRMSQVDPMAHKYSSLTSYNFSFNNPVNHNDPNGADPHQTVFDYIQAQWQSNTIVPLLPALSLEADGIGSGGGRESIVTLFVIAILLFLLGYNFVFNTRKTIAKYISLSKYEEGSNFYKLLSSNSNALWLKIIGVVLLILVVIILCGVIILWLNKKEI